MPDNDKNHLLIFLVTENSLLLAKVRSPACHSEKCIMKRADRSYFTQVTHTRTCCHGLQPSDNQGKLLSLSTGFLVCKT